VINSDVECARNVGADGVHVSAETALDALRSDLPTDALVGVSAHDAAELRAAEVEGADYATLSPIFPSASKPGYGPALGLATFERLVKATSIPVLALGGVGRHNARDCMKAGAAGVAVMGAVMASQWPGESTQHIVETLNG
jgi:thiamine-phosphate pyrophosphorylase